MPNYVKIINKHIVLAEKARYLDNFLFKARGLMFSKPLRGGSGLVLVADNEGVLETTIHMLFVFFPIDVVWLNSKKIVVDIKRGVSPFTLNLAPQKSAKYVLELPKGASKSTKVGDKILFRTAKS